MKYDFSGWATRAGLKCTDGRTIMKDAFIDNDGMTVPLVWNHEHNDPTNVLGHALLQNRDEGVYAYCSFNDTESGAIAKALVQHGDIVSLSIYANQLKQNGSNVEHGMIREVSLVHAGANPGAYIDDIITHSDGTTSEAVIWNDPNEVCIELYHAADTDEKKEEKEEPKSEKKENSDMPDGKKTFNDVIGTMNEEQKRCLYALVGLALEKKGKVSEGDSEEMNVRHNVFDQDQGTSNDVLVHTAMNNIMDMAKKSHASLKDTFLEHAAEYGIDNIEYIFSEPKDIYDRPQWINNQPSDWVNVVINGVHHTPFANVRMQFADITADEARAKGYIKGDYKDEEVFKLLKRVITPGWIYKKQKFDRQDLVDADFDAVPWIKQEMDLKFNEEKARAYLFGDGRSFGDRDKVNPANIVPVISDDDLYTIKVTVTPAQGESLETALVDTAVTAQDDYQGSGNLVGFFAQKKVSKMLVQRDSQGRRLYKDINELATAMNLNKIVKVPESIVPANFLGLMLDLNDYNVGQKNAGKKTFFQNFDIDYNQEKFLMEEQQSGALIKIKSAVLLKSAQG